jgi:hypothetical protein
MLHWLCFPEHPDTYCQRCQRHDKTKISPSVNIVYSVEGSGDENCAFISKGVPNASVQNSTTDSGGSVGS